MDFSINIQGRSTIGTADKGGVVGEVDVDVLADVQDGTAVEAERIADGNGAKHVCVGHQVDSSVGGVCSALAGDIRLDNHIDAGTGIILNAAHNAVAAAGELIEAVDVPSGSAGVIVLVEVDLVRDNAQFNVIAVTFGQHVADIADIHALAVGECHAGRGISVQREADVLDLSTDSLADDLVTEVNIETCDDLCKVIGGDGDGDGSVGVVKRAIGDKLAIGDGDGSGIDNIRESEFGIRDVERTRVIQCRMIITTASDEAAVDSERTGVDNVLEVVNVTTVSDSQLGAGINLDLIGSVVVPGVLPDIGIFNDHFSIVAELDGAEVGAAGAVADRDRAVADVGSSLNDDA